MIVQLIEYLKNRAQGVKHACYGAIVLIVLWSAIAVDHHHAHTWAEKIPGPQWGSGKLQFNLFLRLLTQSHDTVKNFSLYT